MTYVLGQPQDLNINADSVGFQKDTKLIEATGRVRADYKDLQLTGAHLTYETESRDLSMDQGFTMEYDEIKLSGEALNYQIAKKSGRAEEVTLWYRNVQVQGAAIELSEDTLSLKDATFTSCDLKKPHYQVSASNLYLYPKDGWLVAYWGFFWAGGIPLIPVPAYVYDVQAARKGRRNVVPYPQIATNNDDGTLISESLPWNLRRGLDGSVTLTYASRKGWGGGAELNYTTNPYNNGNLRLYGNPVDNLWGGLTHTYSFGEELKTMDFDKLTGESILQVLTASRQFNIDTLISYREKVNYEKVSQLPDLKFSLNEAYWHKLRMDGWISGGLITEESTGFFAERAAGHAALTYPLYEDLVSRFSIGTDLDGVLYSTANPWLRNLGRLQFDRALNPNLTLFTGYSHYFYQLGTSPFRYELYRFNSSDTINFGFLTNNHSTRVGMQAVYNIPALNPQDIDLLLKLGIHCYNINITYRATRGEFNFGVDLN